MSLATEVLRDQALFRNLSSVQLSSYHSHSELVKAMRLLEVSHPEIVTR